jgi:hypothetical protein
MLERIADASPRSKFRFIGVVYLLYFMTAIIATVLTGPNFVVYGDAVNLISVGLYIALTLLFYSLFRPVNKNLSMLAAVFSLFGCGITALGVFNIDPYNINPLAFFGPYCLLIGYLIIRSIFLPRFLGVLMVIAGAGWLIFHTPLHDQLATYIMGLGILGEGLLMLWLLVIGVNVQRWKEQAGAQI